MVVYIEILTRLGFLRSTFVVEMGSSEALCFALVHCLQCILLIFSGILVLVLLCTQFFCCLCDNAKEKILTSCLVTCMAGD